MTLVRLSDGTGVSWVHRGKIDRIKNGLPVEDGRLVLAFDMCQDIHGQRDAWYINPGDYDWYGQDAMSRPADAVHWLDVACTCVEGCQGQPSRQVPEKVKQRAYKLDRGLCALCGLPVALSEATWDHIEPWSWFRCGRRFAGKDPNVVSNIQPAHRVCNNDKSDQPELFPRVLPPRA